MMLGVLLVLGALATPPDVVRVAEVARDRAAEVGTKLRKATAARLATAVLAAAAKHRLTVAIILAVIEVESAYRPDAASHANCHGLMQLSPRTAPEVARALELRYYNLQRVEHNIALGTAYLRYLMNRYGRLDHALTAYNKGLGAFEAGHRRVNDYARTVLKKRAAIAEELHQERFSGMNAGCLTPFERSPGSRNWLSPRACLATCPRRPYL